MEITTESRYCTDCKAPISLSCLNCLMFKKSRSYSGFHLQPNGKIKKTANIEKTVNQLDLFGGQL